MPGVGITPCNIYVTRVLKGKFKSNKFEQAISHIFNFII